MKTGAKTFIDIIAEATGGTASGQIGSGSRIGVVSFADTAMDNTKLITSVDTLKNAVDALAAGGNTNHADAFTKAIGLFDPSSANARVIVMFTDGKTTAGGPPGPDRSAGQGRRHHHLLHRPHRLRRHRRRHARGVGQRPVRHARGRDPGRRRAGGALQGAGGEHHQDRRDQHRHRRDA